jgi:hypothetical protein
MNIPDETLMAFADGELDAAACAVVENAMRDDPEIEKRVAQHRALRSKLQQAYAAELDDAVPERLLRAVRGSTRSGNVVNLADKRRAGDDRGLRSAAAGPRWRSVAAMAASIVGGVGLGLFIAREPSSVVIKNTNGGLVAQGALANALSNQVGAEPSAPVAPGLSFVAKSGVYCRTFTLTDASGSAGLACREAGEWRIRVLAQSASGADPASASGNYGSGNYRMASSALPQVILHAVQEQIAGEPLDQNAELEARRRGWQVHDR